MAGLIVSACSSPSTAGSPSSDDPPAIPLTASASTAAATWAALPMGDLGDPVNTFWQLVTLTAGSSRWKLTTPPGVATNGGLAVSLPPSGSVLAGFGPSQDLLFSPVAESTDAGATWLPGASPVASLRSPTL
jgi:hypothetical protein